MATTFDKGINIVTGFSLGAKAPLDTRYAVATIADRDAHVTNGRAYEGMLVYVEATKIIYRYNGTSWDEFGVTQATTVTVNPDDTSGAEPVATGDIVKTTFTVGNAATSSVGLVLRDIITAGTGCKLTVDAKGRVTNIAALDAADIPTITLSKISDAGTAAALDTGTSAGNVPVLDANGKIDTTVLPSLAITEVTVVASEAAMLALTAQPGDVAVRSDIEKTFMLKEAPASTLANWIELQSPTDAVSSVNGKTGTVVLGTDDIAEGSSNLYWTEARGTSNFTTNFALASSTSLADTANIFYKTDNLPATQVTTDTTHLFVTQDEKALWNAAAHIIVGNTPDAAAIAALNTGDWYYDIGPA